MIPTYNTLNTLLIYEKFFIQKYLQWRIFRTAPHHVRINSKQNGITYENGLNLKTKDFYFSGLRRYLDVQEGLEEMETQLTIFRNSVKACVEAGVQNIVV